MSRSVEWDYFFIYSDFWPWRQIPTFSEPVAIHSLYRFTLSKLDSKLSEKFVGQFNQKAEFE